MKKITLFSILLSVFLLAAQSGLEAHSIGRSSSYWTENNEGVDVRWAMSAREFETLFDVKIDAVPGAGRLDNQLAQFLAIDMAVDSCLIDQSSFSVVPGGDVSIDFHLNCVPDQVSFKGLFRENARHVHLAHVRPVNGEIFDRLITNDTSELGFEAMAEEEGVAANTISYIKLGFLHILEGFDHLAFLIALLLIVRDIRSLFWVISGFTVGHSITLIFGSLNILAAVPEIIEPLIAFSIAFTAWDAVISKSDAPHKPLFIGILSVIILFAIDMNLNAQIPLIAWAGVFLLSTGVWMFALQGEEKSRKILPAVTIGFGLIHGFGFAGVLADIGLPAEGKFPALFGFNVGVELGQLAFVAVMLLIASLGGLMSKKTNDGLQTIIALAVIGLGLFWFAERVFLSGL